MIVDYGYRDRQRLIHPGWLDKLPTPDVIQRRLPQARFEVCRCLAYGWPHAARLTTRCAQRRDKDGFPRYRGQEGKERCSRS